MRNVFPWTEFRGRRLRRASPSPPIVRWAILRKSPAMIAEDLKGKYPVDHIVSEVLAVNGYLNFKINKSALACEVLDKIGAEGERYGAENIGNGRVICLGTGRRALSHF